MNTPTSNELAQKALSSMAKATVPAGLADRAFAAALNSTNMRAEPVKPFAELIAELFRVSRFAAAGACAVAVVLVGVAVVKDGSNADAVVGVVEEEDAWVAQVLPLSTGESS